MKNVTFRFFNDFQGSGAVLTMSFAGILSDDEFRSLIETWHSSTPAIVDEGAYAMLPIKPASSNYDFHPYQI